MPIAAPSLAEQGVCVEVVRFYPVDMGLTKMGGITPRIFVENGTLKASVWEIERVQRRGAVPVTGNPLRPRQPYRTESYHQCWLFAHIDAAL